MTSEEHPPAPDCPTCGDSMKVHPSGWGRWFCMNGHWAGTTDEELRAIRERPGDSPTVSEPRTPTGKWLADQLHDDATAFLALTSGRFSIGNTATKVIDAIPIIEAEAAQPIDVPTIVRIMDLSMEAPGDGQYDAAEWIAARLRASDTDQ